MAENSKIEWCDHTFNPWRGCSKVSEACRHCYAEVSAPSRLARHHDVETWGPNAARLVSGDAYWKQPLRWNREAEKAGTRPRVFVASLADVFEDYRGGRVGRLDQDGNYVHLHDDLTPVLARLFDLIRQTPHLDWLLLTKRPELAMKRINDVIGYLYGFFFESPTPYTCLHWRNATNPYLPELFPGARQPPANIWVGTSVENQEQADARIPHLLAIPARVRFLSCEPLLGPVDLKMGDPCHRTADSYHAEIHWVICGGESGQGSRPMHPAWARSLRDECAPAGVPFFFKQWGEWAPAEREGDLLTVTGAGRFTSNPEWHEFPDGQVMAHIGKRAAGRRLDGVLHDAFPEPLSVSL